MVWLRYLPALVWAASIFGLSSQSRLPGVPSLPGIDKVLHAGAYGLLAAMLLWAQPRPRLALLLAVLYGISDELHQATVPGRNADVLDAVADAAGALMVVALWLRRRGHGGVKP